MRIHTWSRALLSVGVAAVCGLTLSPLAQAQTPAAESSEPAPASAILDLGTVTFDLGALAPRLGSDGNQSPITAAGQKNRFTLRRAEGDEANGELVITKANPGLDSADAIIASWRPQFVGENGQPAPATAPEKLKAGAIDVTFVQFGGTQMPDPMLNSASKAQPNALLLGAVAQTSSGFWYATATGPAKAISQCEQALRAFALSVKAK